MPPWCDYCAFARAWAENPLKGVDRQFYAIHGGTNGGTLHLDDFDRAMELVSRLGRR